VARVHESHKGHDIVIEEPEEERRGVLEEGAPQVPRLFIDEQPVKVIRNSDGTFSSEGVFYAKYPSLLDLARTSIDGHLPEGWELRVIVGSCSYTERIDYSSKIREA